MMPVISLINNSEGAIVLFKSDAELRRDRQQIHDRFGARWAKIQADHAEADAAIKPGVPVLAKADRGTALLEQQKLILEESVARNRLHSATLGKIRDWLAARNRALAEHDELVERSARFAARHARFAE